MECRSGRFVGGRASDAQLDNWHFEAGVSGPSRHPVASGVNAYGVLAGSTRRATRSGF